MSNNCVMNKTVTQPLFHGVPLFTVTSGGMHFLETRYAKDQALPIHGHAQAYMCVVLAGGYEESSRAGSLHAQPGSLLGHPEGHRHRNQFGDAGARCLNVIPDQMWRDSFGWAHLLNDATHTALGARAESLNTVLQELRRPDDLSPLVLTSSVLEIVVNASRRRSERASVPFVRRVIDLVHANIGKTPSMTALALETAVHPAHLSRVFRQQTGMTIGVFARKQRVRVALEQLANTARPLSAIAAQSGFADQAHMTRAVRASTGLTPSAYRKAMQVPFKIVQNIQENP
jgi:AraC family transcriptional regulator